MRIPFFGLLRLQVPRYVFFLSNKNVIVGRHPISRINALFLSFL